LQIRGLWGQPQSYYQVDIEVTETSDGTYRLGVNGASGGVSQIIGQDAVAASYSAMGDESDTVTFMWDKEAQRIVGSFGFTGVGADASVNVSGVFNSSVSESGAWDCNFEDETISRCWFTE